MDELYSSISEIRSSQIEMLSKWKAVNLSHATKLTELLTSIDSLQSQVVEVGSETTTFRSIWWFRGFRYYQNL